MYVKVNQGHEGQDLHFQARNPITSGFLFIDPAEVDTDHGEPEWGDFLMDLIPHGDWYIGEVFTQNFDDEKRYRIRYAWWPSDDFISAVITTRNIFIMGDDGKTIDRVR